MLLGVLGQFELLLRLIVAGLCGYAVGYERNNRLKEAGVRTHLIVCLGSALIMIVSKYGFADVIAVQGVTLDPSRIAAQIISGIGFLGAGMIFVHKQSVNGLTTAAGIWATAGIGIAIGADMYFIGIAATVLIVVFQILLHKDFRWNQAVITDRIKLILSDVEGIEIVQNLLKENHIEILNFKIERQKEGLIGAELYIKRSANEDISFLLNLLKENDEIQYVEY